MDFLRCRQALNIRIDKMYDRTFLEVTKEIQRVLDSLLERWSEDNSYSQWLKTLIHARDQLDEIAECFDPKTKTTFSFG